MNKKRVFVSTFLFLFSFFLLFSNANAAVVPNDPFAGLDPWWLASIRAGDAWEKTTGKGEIVVAVIDGGVDIENPDLKEKIWKNPKEELNNRDDDENGLVDDVNGWDFYDDDPVVSPLKTKEASVSRSFHHGTLISGIIGAVANNNLGVAGINWDVKIMPLRALDDNGNGTVSSVTRAIYYAIQNNAEVINLSIVSDIFDKSLQKAISEAYKKGIVVVAAVGNSGEQQKLIQQGSLAFGEGLSFPACLDAESGFPFIIGVGAIDRNDKVAGFSNYGACTDIFAPGVKLTSTGVYGPRNGLPDVTISNLSGTSLASPFVAGAAALIKGMFPSLNADAIIRSIIDGSRPLNDPKAGVLDLKGSIRGALDIFNALKKAEEFVPKNVIHTLHQEGGKVVWQAFDRSFTKLWKLPFDVNYSNVVAWDVFDYDKDGENELVMIVAKDKVTTMEVFNNKGIKEKEVVIAKIKLLGARIFNLSLEDKNSGGIGVVYSLQGNAKVSLYKINGKLLSVFDTKIPAPSNMSTVDAYWDIQGERVVLASLAAKEIKLYYFDAIGILFEENIKNLVKPLEKKELSFTKFIYAKVVGNAARDAIRIPLKGFEAVVRMDEIDGAANRVTFNAFSQDFKGGVDVDVEDWDHDGKIDVIAVPGIGAAPIVRIFAPDGKLKGFFRPTIADYRGGMQVRVSE